MASYYTREEYETAADQIKRRGVATRSTSSLARGISSISGEGPTIESSSSVKVERLHRPLRLWIDAAGLLYVADYDDTNHADRVVVWRPSDAPTAVGDRSWGDLKRAFR